MTQFKLAHTTYGQSHDWLIKSTIRNVEHYMCTKCDAKFSRSLDDPDFESAMKEAKIADVCAEKKVVKRVKAVATKRKRK